MSRTALHRLFVVGLILIAAGAALWWRAAPAPPPIPPASAPAVVVQLANSSAPTGDRDQAVLASLRATAETDPDRALAQANQLVANRTQAEIYSSLFAEFAARDLPSAIARLVQVPAGAGRDNAIRAIADAWTRTDVPAALAWAQSLPPSDRPAALETVFAALSVDDPLRTIALAKSALGGPARDHTVARALQKLLPVDPAAAAKIIPLLPAGETRTLAAIETARALAAKNPADTLAWIKTLADPATERLALNGALESWIAADSAAAAHYVAVMPSSRAQDAAAEQVARLLAPRDPQSAIAWAQTLPADSARVTALITIGSAWAQHEPAAAVQWAITLPAGAAQTGAVSGAYSYWLLRDAAVAQAWLATATLPADVKARLVQL